MIRFPDQLEVEGLRTSCEANPLEHCGLKMRRGRNSLYLLALEGDGCQFSGSCPLYACKMRGTGGIGWNGTTFQAAPRGSLSSVTLVLSKLARMCTFQGQRPLERTERSLASGMCMRKPSRRGRTSKMHCRKPAPG